MTTMSMVVIMIATMSTPTMTTTTRLRQEACLIPYRAEPCPSLLQGRLESQGRPESLHACRGIISISLSFL